MFEPEVVEIAGTGDVALSRGGFNARGLEFPNPASQTRESSEGTIVPA